MKHSTGDDLSMISNLMGQLRHMGMAERGDGHFYHKGRGVIHFHSDSGKIYADIGTERLEVFDGRMEINTSLTVNKVSRYIHDIEGERD